METSFCGISLSTYLNTVQQVIKTYYAETIWIKAEITNCSSKGGHYYLELTEKDPETHQRMQPLKPPSGVIWKILQIQFSSI